MKKWLLVTISIFILLIAACSDPDSQNDKVVQAPEISLTAEEVYEKATEQLRSIESAAFTMYMEQTMHVGKEDQTTTRADVVGELTEDPFMLHQNGSVSMENPTVGKLEINIEMYTKDEVVYVYEDMFNNWMKGTMDDLTDIGLEIGEDQSPFSHIEDLGEYIDEFTFEQNDDTYTFTLESTSDTFQQLIMEELQSFQVDIDGNEDITEVVDIDQLHYTFTVDKDTFDMLSFAIDFAINSTVDGETLVAESSIGADFSDFNEIEEINIPQEVIDEAVDPEDAFGF